MAGQLSAIDLLDILNAVPINLSDRLAGTLFPGISTDTRTLKPGEVFLALRGLQFDGHEYVRLAIEKGAIAAITERSIGKEFDDIPQLQVDNTLAAYQEIARFWRDRFNIPVVAVTGSAGKTTTKELLAAVLGTQGNVLKTQGNYNNEIGVPKTLLGLSSEHDYAVIEMAMRGVGQIAELTRIAHPTVGVITNVGTAHIGILGSEEAIAKAKCELLAEMPKTSVAVINHDNHLLMETAATVWQGQTVSFGLEGGDLQGHLIAPDTIEVDGMEFPLPLPGKHNALNYLAALAVAKILDLDLTKFTESVLVEMPAGRSQRYELGNDILILDETYNAGLESMKAALQLLSETPGKRHIAVLGAMKELGARSHQFHQEVGETVEELHLDALLVTLDDPEAKPIARGVSTVPTECFDSHEDLLQYLQTFLERGDRVLFKASRSVGLDRVIDRLRF
ncbi:MAG TPA: UDP-N-acetylmuramoyl-tripeptide--D-alanyl-D-alanine ligase [Cyanobacteria bacterium UBA11149]|nr:UDP-N-acetylmuramoyl-tripeptide--D-alanyl-D-alanine ligase [Cyanobacteria bacterium UBA11367]HBE59820.1 UDP-N-acetylmuramoyl-tripeptide--D-alanyl-D-alanine ligase [Cyanobacteria bacterium UBA11366]HBK65187.1 UDP-N-acetylmuramoyl-tripeptide--D-alanyl-D-alanine ligase [Cyanobacteria bacterium UBA11166]HBR76915.1 UDP-N-acetylmuramoyl-tripeptide--D-alanyl-D-alanine ligase [Cyanobacteria bacterium UBA11159]HBS69259.1 UDP-N-acetylmuramoyl-tripeptide--D-alanyl-D-alanine ligase [Cyanobacteria bacter